MAKAAKKAATKNAPSPLSQPKGKAKAKPSSPVKLPSQQQVVVRPSSEPKRPSVAGRPSSQSSEASSRNAWQLSIERRLAALEAAAARPPSAVKAPAPLRQDSVSTADPFDLAAPPRPSTLPPPPPAREAKKGRPATATQFPPCSSKYHTRFSSNDQHASKQCAFCRTCHHLELLFNKGSENCKWENHKPTEASVCHVMRDTPAAIREVALQRLQLLRMGTKLEVMKIGGL